jgi:hypothetical protein
MSFGGKSIKKKQENRENVREKEGKGKENKRKGERKR